MVFYYDSNPDWVYLKSDVSFSCVDLGTPAAFCTLAMHSTGGNVVCGGSVAAADGIFLNGFGP
jgi:hypothetical protein